MSMWDMFTDYSYHVTAHEGQHTFYILYILQP